VRFRNSEREISLGSCWARRGRRRRLSRRRLEGRGGSRGLRGLGARGPPVGLGLGQRSLEDADRLYRLGGSFFFFKGRGGETKIVPKTRRGRCEPRA